MKDLVDIMNAGYYCDDIEEFDEFDDFPGRCKECGCNYHIYECKLCGGEIVECGCYASCDNPACERYYD